MSAIDDMPLKLAIEDYPGGAIIYDAQRRFRFINSRALQRIRYTSEQLLGRRDEELFRPELTDQYVPSLRRAIETRTTQTVQITVVLPTGAVRVVVATYIPILDADGSVQEVLGIGHDVTDQKLAAERLRRREEELRSLADNIPDIVARVDREGRHLYVNRQAELRTGLPGEAFIGKTDRDLGMPDELVELWDRARLEAIATGQPVQIEFACPGSDGVRHFESRFIPETGVDGRVDTVVAVAHDVTDRRRAEQQLRESAERLRRREREIRSLADNAPDTMARVDREGRFVFINRPAAVRTGIPVEQFIGKTTRELGMPAELVDLWDRIRLQMLDTAVPMEFEFSWPSPEGTYYFETRVIPELDADGRVETIVGIARDVTYRRRADERLRESAEQLRRRERELRSLTDNVPDIIARFDGEGRHVYVNRQVESRTGIPTAEFIGKTNRDLGMPADLVEHWDRARQAAFDTAQPVEIEFAYPSPDGTRYFESRIIPERGADGSVETVVGIARDVTDRKLAEMKMQASEERFRSAFQANPIGMILVARDFSFIRANLAFCQMLGYTEEELRGLRFTDISYGDTSPGDLELAEGVFRGDIPSYTYEKQYLTKDRRIIWIRLTATVIRDDAGQPLHGLGMVENITARRAAEEELARHREHLEELVRSRTRALEASQHSLRSAERLASVGTLAAGIAHEINNPVGAILLGTEMAMAAQASGDHAALARCLEAIKGDAQRCGRIVRNVLNFARQEPSDKWPADFNEVVRQAVERVAPYAQKRGATVALRLDGGAPQALMNPTAVEQAVSNILRNAVDSRADAATVAVTTRIDGNHCAVVVEDNGAGMTPEIKMHIFDPFFTTRRTSGGIGLGLSLAHGTIADHRGTIEVESEPGRGTKCTIKLPRLQAACPTPS